MTVAPTISRGMNRAVVTWVLTASETGSPIDMPSYRLRSVTIFGTFGGAVTIQGGNDEGFADTPLGLKDRSGSAISDTSAALHQIPEELLWIQPVAASGVSSVTVRAFYQRP